MSKRASRTRRIEAAATNAPKNLTICGQSGPLEIEAQAAEQTGPKKFSMVAYTGAAMKVGFGWPVVVDLAGMKVPDNSIPILRGHDAERIVGHTENIDVSAQRVKITGLLSGLESEVAQITATAKNGFPWQASIGASVERMEFVEQGQTVKVNGRNFTGPVYVARATTLGETSFVPLGADGATSASVAAKQVGVTAMDKFTEWLKANGFDPATLTEAQTSILKASFEKPAEPKAEPKVEAKTETKKATPFDEKLDALEAENTRIDAIREIGFTYLQSNVGDTVKCKQIRELIELACEDQKTSDKDFRIQMMRFDRMNAGGTQFLSPSKPVVNESVIEAAICKTQGLANWEKKFDEQTLEAADKSFKRGLGLRETLHIAAERNSNYRGSTRDVEAVCRAAFGRTHGEIRASGGPSTITVPGILSNIANKFSAAGFLYAEQSWRDFCKIRTANDYKTMTTYRMTGANKFEKVAPGGEIKHGTLSELSYTNQVDIYAKMIGLDERDIRNDDLNAFTSVSDELGRGAGDALNVAIYTTWLDDSAFFPTDASYNNYDAGATDSVLSLAGLENADNIFASQTKPDGTPLGVMPAILLVPRALRATALNLMNGTTTASAQSTATVTIKNIWEQMFKVVSSVYLQSSAITGYSSTAWYLLADPNNLAALEVAFLDGIDSPRVETADFDFNRFGISMRGALRFGVSKQEYRAGVKLKGAA